MRVSYLQAGSQLGIPPLQVLVELAVMNQPWEECFPQCDDGLVQTVRERRRLRMGLSAAVARPAPQPEERVQERLPVSKFAAAILDKLMRKSYGLKSVRVFTLVVKWVHGATEDNVRELVDRGNLEWTDPGRLTVNLVGNRLPDTERIVEIYRQTQS